MSKDKEVLYVVVGVVSVFFGILAALCACQGVPYWGRFLVLGGFGLFALGCQF